MGLKDFITGIRLTIPVETVAKALAGTFKGSGEVKLRLGAKYALAGEWWIVAGIDSKGIRLEPQELTTKVVEVKGR